MNGKKKRNSSAKNTPLSIATINDSLQRTKVVTNRLLSKYETACRNVTTETKALKRLQRDLAAWREIQELTQHVAATCQNRVHKQICEVVTVCLAAIFDEPYTFLIRFVNKRGRTEAVPVFVRDGEEVVDIDDIGGGVVDIACFALRLAAVVSSLPPIRRLLVLDEPYRFVSKKLRPKVAAMLEAFSKQMKCQIVLTTHEDELQIGKVIRIRRRGIVDRRR